MPDSSPMPEWARVPIQRLLRAAEISYASTFQKLHLIERWFEPKLPFPVRTVLFVCKGNICRSPMGEVYFRRRARELGFDLTVISAGLDTTPGRTAHPYAISEIQKHGLTLVNHATQSLRRETAEQADLIIVMEVAQRRWLTRLYPHARDKVFVAGRFAPLSSLDIADPFSGTPEDFQRCFEAIKQCCDGILERYRTSAPRGDGGELRKVG
jgi:protein-tyrosine phosphatase